MTHHDLQPALLRRSPCIGPAGGPRRGCGSHPTRLRELAVAVYLALACGWAGADEPAPPAPAAPASPTEADGSCDADCLNQRAAADWARASGEAAPRVEQGADGQVRLQWTGSLSVRAQHNRVDAGPPGATNTPLRPGRAALVSLQTEWRLPDLDGGSQAVQLAAQAGDDRATLPRHGSQLQNLSWAYQGAGSAYQFGDHAANFSQLGLQLGYRGVYLQREVQGLQVALLGGTVAESWDALLNRAPRDGSPARNQYLRDITAVQLGRRFESGLNLKAAFGAWRDRVASLAEEQRGAAGVQGRSTVLGAGWQHDALTLSLELAHSRTRTTPLPSPWPDAETTAAALPIDTQSSAGSLDAAWRLDVGQLRFGARRLGLRFASAAAAAPAGTEEVYLAGDATATPGVQLNADLRRTTQRSAASEFAPGSRTVGDRLQLGATFSLAAWLEGLSSTWQASLCDQSGTTSPRNRQAQASASLQWQSSWAQFSLQISDNRSRTPAFAQADSDSRGLQLQAGLPFGAAALAQGLPAWSGQASLGLSHQTQTMTALAAVARMDGVNLGLQAQRSGVGQFTLALQEQASRAPLGGQRLRQRQLQAEGQRALTAATEVRLGLRWAWRNLGDPALLARERTVSVDLQTRW